MVGRRPAPGRRAPMALVAVVLAAVVAGVAAPGAAAGGAAPGHRRGAPHPGAATFEVVTYNLHLGADLTPLFGVDDPAELQPTAAAIWAEVRASSPAERMAAVADVLARERPDVIGLQEVARWEAAPWAPVPGPAGPVPVVVGPYVAAYDLLDLLLGALAARGVAYEVAAAHEGFRSDLPVAIPVSATEAVRYTDRDVLLVRAGGPRRLAVGATAGQRYDAAFTVDVLGTPVAVTRGRVRADVAVRGRTVRVIDTHLEAYGATQLKDEVRNLQAVELAADVAASPHPVVVLGDLNARPTMCATWRPTPQPEDANVVAYAVLEAAGLREVWPLTHRRHPCGPSGWTSGQDDLLGPHTLDHRIDHVFVDAAIDAVRARVVGDEERERSEPTGLWPSDHAATVAQLRLRPGAGR